MVVAHLDTDPMALGAIRRGPGTHSSRCHMPASPVCLYICYQQNIAAYIRMWKRWGNWAGEESLGWEGRQTFLHYSSQIFMDLSAVSSDGASLAAAGGLKDLETEQRGFLDRVIHLVSDRARVWTRLSSRLMCRWLDAQVHIWYLLPPHNPWITSPAPNEGKIAQQIKLPSPSLWSNLTHLS